MSSDAILKLRKRARAVRAADAVRRFEYRQRNHARGVWFRLRRLLSEAASAWRLSEEDARRLIAEGITPEAVGLQIEPPMTILVLSEERLRSVSPRAPLPVRLSAELLLTRHLGLVFWPREQKDGSIR
jgi:hypothetical protein